MCEFCQWPDCPHPTGNKKDRFCPCHRAEELDRVDQLYPTYFQHLEPAAWDIVDDDRNNGLLNDKAWHAEMLKRVSDFRKVWNGEWLKCSKIAL